MTPFDPNLLMLCCKYDKDKLAIIKQVFLTALLLSQQKHCHLLREVIYFNNNGSNPCQDNFLVRKGDTGDAE